jgi:hypothetical protein
MTHPFVGLGESNNHRVGGFSHSYHTHHETQSHAEVSQTANFIQPVISLDEDNRWS